MRQFNFFLLHLDALKLICQKVRLEPKFVLQVLRQARRRRRTGRHGWTHARRQGAARADGALRPPDVAVPQQAQPLQPQTVSLSLSHVLQTFRSLSLSVTVMKLFLFALIRSPSRPSRKR